MNSIEGYVCTANEFKSRSLKCTVGGGGEGGEGGEGEGKGGGQTR